MIVISNQESEKQMDQLSSVLAKTKPNLFADVQESRVGETLAAVAFLSVFLLLELPFEQVDGNPVPAVIFGGRPSLFHAFVLLLNGTFASGLIAPFLRQQYPRISQCCRHIAVLFMVTAVAIFLGLAMVDLLPLLPVSAVVA
ncbi:hypothetical protein Nepgr_017074 [Nepenthes gracilis]|uniref:Uncharacterized protein n=1 Tax=Nepenthes gracilis TaxID=150966 RepID=A0AAD3SPS9_NEPGR|nr:hypothetical protein Nepgr_017074 [Nepenthes gracilis]